MFKESTHAMKQLVSVVTPGFRCLFSTLFIFENIKSLFKITHIKRKRKTVEFAWMTKDAKIRLARIFNNNNEGKE